MNFFEYACQEANKSYRNLGWAGIKEAFKCAEGYMFVADFGKKYDNARMYFDPIIFAIEKEKRLYKFEYGSPRFVVNYESAQPIVVPNKYLSKRMRKS